MKQLGKRHRSCLRSIVLAASFGILAIITKTGAIAETQQVRVATQIGLAYLPLIVMEHDGLWERRAKERGAEVRITYTRLGGGSPLNDALLSDSVEVVAGGVAPMLVVWDRTRANFAVRGMSALNASPMFLLTNRPAVKSIKDLTDQDRIAVPSIRVSKQAIVLAMGVEKAFGSGSYSKFDAYQVAMAHPEAYAALTSGGTPVTAYMSSSPFQELALRRPNIAKIADSFEILDGPSTFSVVYAKSKFLQDNPALLAAYYVALRDADDLIRSDPKGAIDRYVTVSHDKTDRALLESIVASPAYDFDMVPNRTKPVADFMARTGILKTTPQSWQDYFAPSLHNRNGS